MQVADRPPIRPRRSSARIASVAGLGLISAPTSPVGESSFSLPGTFPASPRKGSATSHTSTDTVQAGLKIASSLLSKPRSPSLDAASPKASNRRAQISGPLEASGGKIPLEGRRVSKVGDDKAGSLKILGRPNSFGVSMDGSVEGESTYFSQADYASGQANLDAPRKSSIPITPPLRILNRKKTPPRLSEPVSPPSATNSIERAYLRSSTFSTPPSTPPHLSHSVYSDSAADVESVRSSLAHNSWPANAVARKLEYPEHTTLPLATPEEIVLPSPSLGEATPKLPAVTAPDDAVPLACPIEQEPDMPGIIRRDSAATSASEFDDEDSVNEFSLEDFPVPSSVIGSPLPPHVAAHLSTASTGIAVDTLTTIESTPRPDLFKLNSSQSASMTWSLEEELEIRDRVFRAEMKAMSKADKQRRRELKKHFNQWEKPTQKQMYEASLLSLRDEYGNRIRFGSLFEGQRTIVCFIRHFWCSMCQSYVDAIAKVKPAVLDKYGLRLIIVSNGSWKMIKGYKKLLGDRCPYPIYTDRGKHVYTAMGMTLRTFNAGKNSEKGDYIPAGMMTMTMRGIVQGLALPMKPPGDQAQLGGEFVLGPGLKVTYAHRMKSTRGHADPNDILASMDINLAKENEALQPTPVVATPLMGMFSSAASTISRRTSAASASSPRLSSGLSSAMSSQPGTSSTTHTAVFPSEKLDNPASATHKSKLSPRLGSWREKRKIGRLQQLQAELSPRGISSDSIAQQQLAQQQLAQQQLPSDTPRQLVAPPSKPRRLSKRKSVLASRDETNQAQAEEERHSFERRRSEAERLGAISERPRSVPHIQTPEPVSPISLGFLDAQRNSGVFQTTASPLSSGSRMPSDRSQNSQDRALLQVPGAAPASPASTDIEASSSRFSSSSEESTRLPLGVGHLAKTIRMHLKVSSGPGSKHGSIHADDASITSRGSLRVRTRDSQRA